MYGLMQDWPLLCHRVIEHAARQHGQRRVVSRTTEGPIKVTNYAQVHERALRVSKRLLDEGIKPGDRVATLAWSSSNHLECWYGIAGIGAIYHPVNPRLFSEQLVYIINDGQDRILLLDTSFVELAESLADRLPAIARYVILTDRANMPATRLRGAIAYEDWIAEVDADYAWQNFDENTAASLMYTSGTTGAPKGVLYSHRSIVLMSLTSNSPDMYGFGSNDVVLQVVPMCHANGWTWPFSAPMAGASLVFPGARLDGAALGELLLDERVTCTGGVPTIWQTVLTHCAERGVALKDLKRVFIGGSPASRSMIEAFRDIHGAEVISVYGGTEMGPMAAACSLMPETKDFSGDALAELRRMQGRPPFLVEFQVFDDNDATCAWDGVSVGHLRARGPCIIQAYYGRETGNDLDRNGFFDTGDIATINEYGYIRLTDRAKDLVKSGGEWISSIDIENLLMSHPGIYEAAVIGIRHPKWDERPVVVAVRREGMSVSKEDLLRFLEGKIANWWMPDDVVFVDTLPHTATGKLHKTVLRKQFENYQLPQLVP